MKKATVFFVKGVEYPNDNAAVDIKKAGSFIFKYERIRNNAASSGSNAAGAIFLPKNACCKSGTKFFQIAISIVWERWREDGLQ